MFKRITLFIVSNVLVVLTLSIVLNLLGVAPYLQSQGIDYVTLAIFCFMWGMVGALISLALSKTMAIQVMGVQLVPQNHPLYQKVQRLALKANLPNTPDVGIFSSPELNAFATGATQKNCLVAVSSGLLENMAPHEIEGVLGHELAHIRNGDMVTMTLLQGITNAFVMFLARILASVIVKNQSRNSYMGYFMIVMFLETVFMLLGSLVICWFSRKREFKADEGGAIFAGKQNMIQALHRLLETQSIQDPKNKNREAFQAFKISTPQGLTALFSTHPPLKRRIQHLKEAYIDDPQQK